jgi:hypothetical protein
MLPGLGVTLQPAVLRGVEFFLVIYGPSEGLVYLSSDPPTGRQVPQHDERSSVMNPRALPCIVVKAAMALHARASPDRYCLSVERLNWVGVQAGTLDALYQEPCSPCIGDVEVSSGNLR